MMELYEFKWKTIGSLTGNIFPMRDSIYPNPSCNSTLGKMSLPFSWKKLCINPIIWPLIFFVTHLHSYFSETCEKKILRKVKV